MNPFERLRLEKSAADCGFELTPCIREDGALELRSAAFPEVMWISTRNVGAGKFQVRASTKALLDVQVADTIEVDGYEKLYPILQRASAIARTMPNRIADKYRLVNALLPVSTEAERLVVQRLGQGLFRDALLDYWQGRCCVTGLAVSSLLRASHIKPWAKCETDDERLDVFNGLLLAPHVDALFDGGWISFLDNGGVIISPSLPGVACAQLGVSLKWRLCGLKPRHALYLEFHRQYEFRSE